MATYKLIIAYDGTDYFGWQKQKNLPTIQGTLQEIFKKVFHHDVFIMGASRTDAGVHAGGQVAGIKTSLDINPQDLKSAWNNLLPENILIKELEKVADNYSSHKNVVQKIYYYHFFQERPDPFISRYGWHYPYPIDKQKLHNALQIFVGMHDFRSFCTGYDREDTIRTIDSASIEFSSEFNTERIVIKGQKFLHHMVRRIVGACLHVAHHDNLNIDILSKALAAKSPAQELPNAPAKGLMLHHIIYQKDSHE